MNKLIIAFFLLATLVNVDSHAAKEDIDQNKVSPTVNAWFTPNIVNSGESVTFNWNSRQGYACQIQNIPGYYAGRFSGSYTFTATQSIRASVACEGRTGDNFGYGYANLTVKAADPDPDPDPDPKPLPTINISFNNTVYTTYAYDLKVTTQNASSCTYSENYNGAVRPPYNIGTSYSARFRYATPGNVVQIVNCSGPGGSSEKTHTVRVISGQSYPPVINHFTYTWADIDRGNLRFVWSSSYTDRCTFTDGKITDNVPVTSLGYAVTVPFGKTTYTLTCYKGSVKVQSSRLVTRYGNLLTTMNNPISNEALALKDGEQHNLDLQPAWITTQNVFVNHDSILDLIIHDAKNDTLTVIYNNESGLELEQHTFENIYNIDEVHSMLLDSDGELFLTLKRDLIK